MLSGGRDLIFAAPMASAWREAARDLAIRFESPFALRQGDREYWCSGLLPDFGCPAGAVIIDRHSLDDIFDAAEALGYYVSGLNPLYYESYSRERFTDALNDWGWFGEVAAAPAWFTGGFGRHGGASGTP